MALRIGLATFLASVLLILFTAPAAAACGMGSPACTILRPPPTDLRRVAPFGAPACIVLVGGFGSPTDGSDDAFFAEALGPLANDPAIRLIRFGVTDGTYDTTGRIDPSASELRDVLRRASNECSRIHVFAHSMGGVVADRALAKLTDPSALGVATYVPMSSPHNGSYAARMIAPPLEDDALLAAAVSTVTSPWRMDPTRGAASDLARVTPPRPPRGIAELRVRGASDAFVLYRDWADRRYAMLELAPENSAELLNGHARIVGNSQAQTALRATIAGSRVPEDDRWWGPRLASLLLRGRTEELVSGILTDIGALLRAVALLDRLRE